MPIGLEEFHEGVVDLVRRRALTFGGGKGQEVVEGPVPAELEGEMEARRAELVERVSEVREWGGRKVGGGGFVQPRRGEGQRGGCSEGRAGGGGVEGGRGPRAQHRYTLTPLLQPLAHTTPITHSSDTPGCVITHQVDDELAELFLAEEPISAEALAAAIRRATLALRFQPVFMGSAFKNKGKRVSRGKQGGQGVGGVAGVHGQRL
jgi:translation elongation factor EF-G